jgi:hypothetical protein
LNEEVAGLGTKMDEVKEMQSLEWAIDHATYGSFDYYSGHKGYSYGTRTNSSVLVVTVLYYFRQGFGCYVENTCTMREVSPRGNDTAEDVKGRENFRAKLSAQIHALTELLYVSPAKPFRRD